MQLRHDHTLGAVDHERTRARHQGDFSHVDFLLFHLFGRGLGGLFVHDDQAHFGAQRRGKGQAALLTFLYIERRLAEHVAYVFEARVFRVTFDRINRLKRRLQPFRLAGFGRGMFLQERGKRGNLRRQQIRHRKHVVALREALADTFFLGKGVGHGDSGRES